jgi:hypothetical protein
MHSFLNVAAIPILAEVDILVVGAGSAGCCAALAAREGGKYSVLLAERYGFLGGTSTWALDTFYGFYTPGPQPRRVVGGLPARIVDALDESDSVFLRPNTYGAGTGVNYDPERLKLVWDQMTEQAGVQVLGFALLVDVETDAGGQLRGAVVATKSGFFRIHARRFIDASGDADLCHLAGIPYEKAGETEPAQTLTTTFRLCNVDLDAFEAAGGKKMLQRLMEDAVDSGRHALPRRKGSAHAMVQPGCVSTVAVRVADVDATNVRDLTAAEREGRRQSFVFEEFFRDVVPGYENARLVGLSTQIGVRETRRVYGEHRLTREECLGAARFADKVLLCGTPIEDHRQNSDGEEETHWAYVPEGEVYEVPYRALVPRGRDEVWAIGRCFSATHDAHASCRSMAQTMAMGEAAGLAAAQSLDEDMGARHINVAQLQEALRQSGAVLEQPTQIAATAAQAWREGRLA